MISFLHLKLSSLSEHEKITKLVTDFNCNILPIVLGSEWLCVVHRNFSSGDFLPERREREGLKCKRWAAVRDCAHCWVNWVTKGTSRWTLTVSNGLFSTTMLDLFLIGFALVFVLQMSSRLLRFPSYVFPVPLSIFLPSSKFSYLLLNLELKCILFRGW